MATEIILVAKLEGVNLQKFLNRGSVSEEVKVRVAAIVQDVKQRKLAAILEYTEKFDGVKLTPEEVKVSESEMTEAYAQLSSAQLAAIRESIKRVTAFHSKQKQAIKDIELKSKEGKTTLRWVPITKAGIYAPAGKAPLPSSVLMAAIPAKIAGVREFILCSPPQKNGKIDPSILVVANECGIKEIYKIGGAQAIAAMAYGCELFDGADVIAGPGNVYTAYAKQLVASEGIVKIDTIAGPTEVVVIADETANAGVIASDMLAQAEHGINSSSICIATSESLAQKVARAVAEQLQSLPNNGAVAASIQNFGAVLVAKSIDQSIDFVNRFAPEHVEIFTKNSNAIAKKIVSVGAIFVGTGEVFGDYGMTGSNHILPTGCAARFVGGVSVFTFLKYQMVEQMDRRTQARLASATATFARLEKLEAHARSAEWRGKK